MSFNKWTIRRLLQLVCSVLLTFTLACSSSGDDDDDTNGEDPGTVSGKITAPDNQTPVSYAQVTLLSKDGSFSSAVQSDAVGVYAFTGAPDTTLTLAAKKGHFEGQTEIVLSGGKVVQGSVDLAVTIDSNKIGVIAGAYDDIGEILTDMNIQYDTLLAASLTSWDLIKDYQIIFANCGSVVAPVSTSIANIRKFVEESGGSYYASDWEYKWIQDVWPSYVTFRDNAKSGNKSEIVAEVDDTQLAAYLGSSQMNILFDLSSWVVMDSVASTATVHVSGNVDTVDGPLTDKPLLTTFKPGNGFVIYTSFHNEAQATDDAVKVLKYFVFEL